MLVGSGGMRIAGTAAGAVGRGFKIQIFQFKIKDIFIPQNIS